MRARDESEGQGRGMRSHSMVELIPSSSFSSCSREITDITRKIASLSNDFRWDSVTRFDSK
jgi:hypothetical protein